MKQETALDILKQGENVFLTGEAGSGKTHVLNRYIHWLRTHHIEPAVTASTGIAATHINGTTIHSWSGMGIADTLTDELRGQLAERSALSARIRKASVLIIDEISMISPAFLDGVDQICRDAHCEQSMAFGGMQVVFCGDFFQLPPIGGANASRNGKGHKRYAWQSQAWLDAQIVPCYISEQHRQREDDALLRLLSIMRSGEMTDGDLEDLAERFDATVADGLEPTRLYTHNEDVDRINSVALEKIDAQSFFYEMETQGSVAGIEALKRGCLAPEVVELREGAQVMFVKNNYEKGYINGSLGTVIAIDKDCGYPLVELYTGGHVLATPEEWVREKDGKRLAMIRQVPLRLAWAMTVHKSQGMSLDAAEIDLSKCFEVGQGYVALSRVRSIEGLYIRGFNAMASQVDPLTIKVDKRFKALSHKRELLENKQTQEHKEHAIKAFILQAHGTEDAYDYKTQKEQARKTTTEKTQELLREGKSLEEIARERGLAVGTIIGHILSLLGRGEDVETQHLVIDATLVEDVRRAYDALAETDAIDTLYSDRGEIRLKPLYDFLNGRVAYDDIRRALVHILA